MKATICDFCKIPIETAGEHQLVVDKGEPLDMCGDCFTGSVILSECRRSRTRRRTPKKQKVRHSSKKAAADFEAGLDDALGGKHADKALHG